MQHAHACVSSQPYPPKPDPPVVLVPSAPSAWGPDASPPGAPPSAVTVFIPKEATSEDPMREGAEGQPGAVRVPPALPAAELPRGLEGEAQPVAPGGGLGEGTLGGERWTRDAL